MNPGLLLLTGFTSAFNCVALQTGLLASSMPAEKRASLFVTLVFLTAKLFAYVLLGFILGAFGQVITLAEGFAGWLEIIAALYIILSALNILGVHPIFRYLVIQPPSFIFKYLKGNLHFPRLFSPALLGAATILIPCGTTVAVETLAISSANLLKGAAIMGIFTLGTTPVFLGYGFLSSYLGQKMQQRRFEILEGLVVLSLGLLALYQTLKELGIIKIWISE